MRKKINRFLFKNNLYKPVQIIYNMILYSSTIWLLEFKLEISLFLKLAILFGVINFFSKK
jgi:hypothetical protein